MLKKFCLKNYKTFKNEIVIDFSNIAGYQFSTDCISNGLISKMLIYGRNATGKTNLGRAITDICGTVFGSVRFEREGIFLNADSDEEAAEFIYEFIFGEDDVIYKYKRKSPQELKDEELIVNGNSIFRCDFKNDTYNFDNLLYINAETARVDRYMQMLRTEDADDELHDSQLPFFRWLANNSAFDNDSPLIKLLSYVRRMNMVTVSNAIMAKPRQYNENFFDSLDNEKKLQDFEDFLNIMGIECRLVIKRLPDGQRQLYFRHHRLVPFSETASSGTLALVHLYRRLIPRDWEPSFIYLDEFDAFYHYEMAENVMKFLKSRYPESQIIMTSHNTNLMTNRLMRPDCLFILSRSGSLTSLCNATPRELREGHNLEKMYISGEFEKYE